MENKELIELKVSTIKKLRAIDVDSYALNDTDSRLPEYINMCIAEPDKHNLYELLSIVRFFFYLLDKYEYRASKVREFITLFEFLKFSGRQRSYKNKSFPSTDISVCKHKRVLSQRYRQKS